MSPIKLRHTAPRSLGNYPEGFDDTISYRTQLDALELKPSMKAGAKPGENAMVWHLRVFDEDGTAFIDDSTGEAWDLWAWTDDEWWTNHETGKRSKPALYADAFLGHELDDSELEDLDNDGWEEVLVGKFATVSYEIKAGNDGKQRVYVAKMRPYRQRRKQED